MQFHYNDLHDHAPAQEPRPLGHEIYNFGRLSLSLNLVCIIYPREYREEDYKRHNSFSLYD